MKIILIIIDGLGDESIPQLGNKTPLEAAKNPNLDWLAKNGVCGLVLPYLQNKKPPTSEDAHLALFGYHPKIYNPGRGLLEVMGIGMEVLAGDVCLRGNFATLDRKMEILDRRAGRISQTLDLIRAIGGIEIEGVKFLIGKAISHRIGIVMRPCPDRVLSLGTRVVDLSPKISDGDPKKAKVKPLKIRPLDSSKEAKFTARILNQFLAKAQSILEDHPLNKKREKQGKLPANYILVRGAGTFKRISSFEQKYRVSACCIAGGFLYKGLGKYLGMDLIEVERATGLPDTNLRGKFLAAKKALSKYDFIYCHIKAPDNLAEDGNFRGKRDFIEEIDKKITTLINLKNVLLVITADHSTCSLGKRHCAQAIPILIFGDGVDSVKEFSEKACQRGSLGKFRQLELMPKLLTLAKV